MAFSIVQNGDLAYLLAPNLTGHKSMLHAFTTRVGGVSEGEYASLNLAFHVGDNAEHVIANRKKVAQAFGKELSDTVAVRQIHGTHIQKVTAQDKGQGALSYNEEVPEADALITDQPGILLWCFFADCVPVLFYDAQKQVIAVAHAGWRGTQQKIAAKTIRAMITDYGCKAENILAAIGPSAGLCCYDVKQDVAELFSEVGLHGAVSVNGQIYRVDLWKANKLALLEAGVPEKNISSAELCTACLTPLLFSYRAENAHTGRFAAAIMLK